MPRGRGLDALFESSPGPTVSSQEVDADLAALLDREVQAAQGGGAFVPSSGRGDGSGRPAPIAATRAPVTPREAFGAPPLTVEAQPAQPQETIDIPSLAAEPERVLPVTKRIGAIIMDVAPAAPTAPAVPTRETAETVGPAGEIIEEAPQPQAPAPPGVQPAERPLPAVPEGAEELKGLVVKPERVMPAGRAAEPAGPGAAPEERPLPVAAERTEDQKTIIIERLNKSLDKNWQKALHQQIDDLYKQVTAQFNSPPANAEKALNLLREARQMLIETPEEYVAAEYRTMQVRAMLNRTQESRKQSAYFGPRILGYEAGWMILFLLGIVFGTPLAAWVGRLGNLSGAMAENAFPFWHTMMWGGIGGVIGALYHLWWHVSEKQDFDRQYFLWYLVQPIMGLVLGGIVFLLMAGGFLVFQVDLTNTNASTAARLVPYLVAVLGGFRQNFIYEQFDRLIALFTPASQKQSGGGEGSK
jgi:hypothetical protein